MSRAGEYQVPTCFELRAHPVICGPWPPRLPPVPVPAVALLSLSVVCIAATSCGSDAPVSGSQLFAIYSCLSPSPSPSPGLDGLGCLVSCPLSPCPLSLVFVAVAAGCGCGRLSFKSKGSAAWQSRGLLLVRWGGGSARVRIPAPCVYTPPLSTPLVARRLLCSSATSMYI
jgi:hypothetical protein